jgi:hypothetical protein
MELLNALARIARMAAVALNRSPEVMREPDYCHY